MRFTRFSLKQATFLTGRIPKVHYRSHWQNIYLPLLHESQILFYFFDDSDVCYTGHRVLPVFILFG